MARPVLTGVQLAPPSADEKTPAGVPAYKMELARSKAKVTTVVEESPEFAADHVPPPSLLPEGPARRSRVQRARHAGSIATANTVPAGSPEIAGDQACPVG
jgi:hypothetical protein